MKKKTVSKAKQKELSKTIKYLKIDEKLNNKVFADMLGINDTTFSSMINGNHSMTVANYNHLCLWFDYRALERENAKLKTKLVIENIDF